jgi:hypothetical protein
MSKFLGLLFFLLLSVAVCESAYGQFRMVSNGTPSWSTINDSTYSATVNFHADLTGSSFNATQVAVDDRVFVAKQAVYRVSAASGQTVSSAVITAVRIAGSGAPAGQVMVYRPEGRETVPQVPFGSTGATAQLQAAVVTWNSKLVLPEKGHCVLAASAGAVTMAGDCATGELLMAGNYTFSIDDAEIGYYTVRVDQDATGGHTLTFTNNPLTQDGVALTISSAANSKSLLVFYFDGSDFLFEIGKNYD